MIIKMKKIIQFHLKNHHSVNNRKYTEQNLFCYLKSNYYLQMWARSFVVIFLLLFPTNLFTQQPWYSISSEDSTNYVDVLALSKDSVLIIGSMNYIKVTYDGGKTWDSLLINVNYQQHTHWSEIIKIDNKKIAAKIILDYKTVLAFSNDNAKSWKIIDIGKSQKIHAMHTIEKIVVVCLIDNERNTNKIIFFSDEGIAQDSLIPQYYPDNLHNMINAIYFRDRKHALMIVSDMFYSYLYKSTNGGITWKKINIDDRVYSSTGIFYHHPTNRWIIGGQQILASTDDGESWNVVSQLPVAQIIAADSSTSFGVFGDTPAEYRNLIAKSTDAGYSWQVQYLPILGDSRLFPHFILASSFADAQVGYAVGYNGAIYKTTNGGGLGVQENDFRPMKRPFVVIPNPAVTHAGIIVESSDTDRDIRVINLLGEEVFRATLSEYHQWLSLPINNLASGLYFIRMGNQLTKFVIAKY